MEAELRRLKDGRTLEEIRDAALAAHDELMALDVFDAIDLVLTEGTKVGLGSSACHTGAVPLPGGVGCGLPQPGVRRCAVTCLKEGRA